MAARLVLPWFRQDPRRADNPALGARLVLRSGPADRGIAGVVRGRDYPMPIVDHGAARATSRAGQCPATLLSDFLLKLG